MLLARLPALSALTLAALATTLFTATPAHAEPGASARSRVEPEASPAADQPVAKVSKESHWYGYQTLAVDAAALGLYALSGTADGTTAGSVLGTTGVVAYAVVPGVIHLAHHSPGKAVGDLALRVGTPLVAGAIGFVIGLATYSPPPPSQPATIGEAIAQPIEETGRVMRAGVDGLQVGALIGAAAAIGIDAAFLAREDVRKPEPAPTAAAKTASTTTIVPSLGPTKNGFSAGLSGTF